MIDQRKKRLLLVLLTTSIVRQTNSNDEVLGFKRDLRKTERQSRVLQDEKGIATTLGIEELLESQGWTEELESDQGTYLDTGIILDTTKNAGDFETEKSLAIQKDQEDVNDINDDELSKEAR
jgi:hypothetical protein